jgi:hypothetical protein
MLEWTLRSAAQPITWAFSFCFTCIVVGRFPYLNKWTGFLLVAAPAYGALQASPNLTPNLQLNDIFSRFVIILFSHMVALSFMKYDYTNVRQNFGESQCDPRLNTCTDHWKREEEYRSIMEGGLEACIQCKRYWTNLGEPISLAQTEKYCHLR